MAFYILQNVKCTTWPDLWVMSLSPNMKLCVSVSVDPARCSSWVNLADTMRGSEVGDCMWRLHLDTWGNPFHCGLLDGHGAPFGPRLRLDLDGNSPPSLATDGSL